MPRRDLIVIIIGSIILTIILILLTIPKNSSPTDNSLTSAPPDTTTTDSSGSGQLQSEDLVVGTGKEATTGSTVTVNYTGTLVDGTKFDSSYDRNEPFTTQIGTGAVIKGWDQGIPGMKVGGKRRLTIPGDLGYGPTGAGDKIPPNATLIFEIELLDVK